MRIWLPCAESGGVSMAISEREIERTNQRMEEKRSGPIAVAAYFDRDRGRVVVSLSTGLELSFPPRIAQGLEHATPEELSLIEISPTGLGLHWPKIDADLYVPGLLTETMGSREWMAAQLGAAGGRARSPAKAAAARENGRRGGRPTKAPARAKRDEVPDIRHE